LNIAKLSGSPYYSAVLDVPKDVRGVVGRTSFRKSLKTSDKRKALALAHPIVADWKEQIADARRPAPKSIHDKLQIIQEDIDNISSKMEDPLLSDSEYEKLDNLVEVTKDAALDLLVKSKGVKHEEELSELDEAEVIKSFKIVTGQNVLFTKHLEQHLQELQLDQKTIDNKKQQILRYSKVIPILGDSNRTAVRAYTRHLLKNENLKNKTVRRDLSNLSVYWEYLRDEVQVLAAEADNPFKGQALPKEDSKALLSNSRLAFSINDIAKLDEALKSNKAHPEDYEIFLIAIYTGARREEIGQLKLKDINVTKTKEVISMEIEAAKTKASNRIVPIHPNIASMIGRKIEHLKDGDAYIFKTLRNNKYGKRTDALGKRFGRLKEALGFGERYVFHSIRKTVTTLMEQAGVAEGITADIVGHEKQTMTYGLYSGGTSMEQKTDAIKRIDYGIHTKVNNSDNKT